MSNKKNKKVRKKNTLQNKQFKKEIPKKKEKNLKKILDILIIIFIIVIIISIVLLINKKKEEKETYIEVKESIIPYKEEEKEEISIEEEIKELKSTYNNNDIIGVISIKGGDLSTPVVQTNDNQYYLKYSLTKKRSIIGAVFMDYRVNSNSKQINIYGHNSTKYKPPFQKLEKYLEKSYYKDHNILELKIENEIKSYEIFSIVIADKVGTEEHMNIKYKTDKEYYNHFKRLKNRSLYDTGVNIEESDNVLVLQTCIYGKYKGKLLVIVAKEIKEN
jgi:sortase B